jgi:hypothetical protein
MNNEDKKNTTQSSDWWRKNVDSTTGIALIVAAASLIIGVAAQLDTLANMTRMEDKLKKVEAKIQFTNERLENAETRLLRTIRKIVLQTEYIESPYGIMYDTPMFPDIANQSNKKDETPAMPPLKPNKLQTE